MNISTPRPHSVLFLSLSYLFLGITLFSSSYFTGLGQGNIVPGDFAVRELDRAAGDGSHTAFAARKKGTMAGRACRPVFDRGRSGDRMFPVVETEVEFCKGK